MTEHGNHWYKALTARTAIPKDTPPKKKSSYLKHSGRTILDMVGTEHMTLRLRPATPAALAEWYMRQNAWVLVTNRKIKSSRVPTQVGIRN